MNQLIENITFIDLPITTCGMIDIPNGSLVDCSTSNSSICIRCAFHGRFFTEEGINDVKSPGHIFGIVIWLATLIVGTFATLGNFVIIGVFQRRSAEMGFDKFLIGLAICDLVCTVLSIMGATAYVLISQNWDRGIIVQYIFLSTLPLAITMHSASSFVTVVIIIERYLVISFPFKFGKWFTSKRTKLITIIAILLPVLLGLLRLPCFKIVPNTMNSNITSVQQWKYIIVSTSLYELVYLKFGYIGILEFWIPFPLLLIFNGLVYYHVRMFVARQKRRNSKNLGEIQAAKMFLPVVIVLFLCNIAPFLYYFFILKGIIYRELGIGCALSYVVNSAANLPIYYFGGTNFKQEALHFITKFIPGLDIYNFEKTEKQSKESSSRRADFNINIIHKFEDQSFA